VIGTGRESLDRARDQVEIDERRAGRLEEICGRATRGAVQRRGQLFERDGAPLIEGARRAAPPDDAVE
jgi:hypothetical protein